MFVRICVLLLSLGLASCQTGPLVNFAIDTGINGTASLLHPNKSYGSEYNCTNSLFTSDICKKDAEKLATADRARVCEARMTNCKHKPIEQTTSLTRRCYSSDGESSFCWFEDRNT